MPCFEGAQAHVQRVCPPCPLQPPEYAVITIVFSNETWLWGQYCVLCSPWHKRDPVESGLEYSYLNCRFEQRWCGFAYPHLHRTALFVIVNACSQRTFGPVVGITLNLYGKGEKILSQLIAQKQFKMYKHKHNTPLTHTSKVAADKA